MSLEKEGMSSMLFWSSSLLLTHIVSINVIWSDVSHIEVYWVAKEIFRLPAAQIVLYIHIKRRFYKCQLYYVIIYYVPYYVIEIWQERLATPTLMIKLSLPPTPTRSLSAYLAWNPRPLFLWALIKIMSVISCGHREGPNLSSSQKINKMAIWIWTTWKNN